jgi:acyl-CoA synthetase (AMP-forming)/AMP-acid ligase II
MDSIESSIIIIIGIMASWYVYSTTILYRKKRKSLNKFLEYLKRMCQVENVKILGTNMFISGRKLNSINKFNIAVNFISTDIIFLWLTSLAFKRKDLIILKGEIEKNLDNEIEIMNLNLSGGRMLRNELLKRGWKEIFNNGKISAVSSRYINLFNPPNYIWRISLRKDNPPLLVIMPFNFYNKLNEVAKFISNISKN